MESKLAVLAAKLDIAEQGIKLAVESGLDAVIVEAANAHAKVAAEIDALAWEWAVAA